MKPKQILELEDYWGIEISNREYSMNKYQKLIRLSVPNKGITEIGIISSFIDLETLNLSSNPIDSLKPLQYLTNLSYLNLTKTEITDTNLYTLKNHTSLQSLLLNQTDIANIYPLKDLTQLQHLSLAHTRVRHLHILEHFSKLVTLDLEYTPANDIIPLMRLIKKGVQVYYTTDNSNTGIKLKGTPLPSALIHAIHQGNKAVLDYLDNLEKEEQKGARPLNEAKMVIIGEPDAGKTSLMNYLLGKPFTETKTTQGIKIEPWEITDEAGTPYRINIWDFGGQEIQSTVHKFFLTQETLYVVVLNARKDEQPDKYLEQIRSYAPNSPVIIVINRSDENNGSVNEAQLRAEYRTESGESMVRGIYKTSIRRVHEQNDPFFLPAVQELETSIIRELLQMPNIRQIVPQNYFEVKNYLESRFFKDEPYITHERYEAICREKNLELASDEPLLKILDSLGTVRYFDEMHTRHLHILNPEWLSDGVYRILTSEYTHQQNGVISDKDFSRILYKTDAHTFAYPKQHYGYLIEMIRRFYLGYINPDTHKIFIPQAFQSDYPIGFQPDVFKEEALHFFFRYETHIPAGAISSFIARTFGQVRGHFYWQKGIVIERNEADEIQTALVMQTDTKNRIDIWVQGTHRREFFIEIRKLFREFHERYPGLKVDEMIGLDARKETSVKYRVLIAQKHKGKVEYTDEEGNDYNIDRLLGMFESPASTQQAIIQNFQGDYYDMRGVKQVQIIQVEAESIADELVKFQQSASEQNQALLNQLIADLKELQKAESPKKAKGILAQLRETAKNLPKIASEEAVKWATKTALDGASFGEKFDSLQQRVLNLLQDNSFQDFIKPDNWG